MATLEEEIKQRRFQSDYHKAVVNVMYTGNWLHAQNSCNLKQFQLTPEQYNVLRILRGSHPKPLMLTDITSRMLDKSSNATRLVEKLRLKNLVRREQCENNRRQVDIMITGKGLELLQQIDREQEEWNFIDKKISTADAKELNRILDAIRS